jgi:hypothetical protein
MKKVGLDKSDVIMIFKRAVTDEQTEYYLRESIARVVGEIIEENNRMLVKEFINIIKDRRNN